MNKQKRFKNLHCSEVRYLVLPSFNEIIYTEVISFLCSLIINSYIIRKQISCIKLTQYVKLGWIYSGGNVWLRLSNFNIFNIYLYILYILKLYSIYIKIFLQKGISCNNHCIQFSIPCLMFLPLLLKLKLKILGFVLSMNLALTEVPPLWDNANWGPGPIPRALFSGNAKFCAVHGRSEVTNLFCNFSLRITPDECLCSPRHTK